MRILTRTENRSLVDVVVNAAFRCDMNEESTVIIGDNRILVAIDLQDEEREGMAAWSATKSLQFAETIGFRNTGIGANLKEGLLLFYYVRPGTDGRSDEEMKESEDSPDPNL